MATGFTLEDVVKRMPIGSNLTPFEILPRRKGLRYVKCKCICGKIIECYMGNLLRASPTSCGCVGYEYNRRRLAKYFPHNRKIYMCFQDMMHRCYKGKNKSYHRYGGRGVTVCEEWKNDYQKFLDWALANGWKEGLQLDKDIKGTGFLYCPEYCCFVTRKENNEHKPGDMNHLFNGKKMSVSQISKIVNIPANVLSMRMSSKDISVQEAIEMGKKGWHFRKHKIFRIRRADIKYNGNSRIGWVQVR